MQYIYYSISIRNNHKTFTFSKYPCNVTQLNFQLFEIILASVLAKNVTYCTNSTKLDKISVRMARTQPGCVGKFSVVVLILMFTKQKNLNLSAQLLTVLFGRQPICTTANFFSRGGSDRPYFLTFLARTQASMDKPYLNIKKHLDKLKVN